MESSLFNVASFYIIICFALLFVGGWPVFSGVLQVVLGWQKEWLLAGLLLVWAYGKIRGLYNYFR